MLVPSELTPRSCQFNAQQARETLFPEYELVTGTLSYLRKDGVWDGLFGVYGYCEVEWGRVDGHVFLRHPVTHHVLDFSWLKEWSKRAPNNDFKRSREDFAGRVWPVTRNIVMYEGTSEEFNDIGLHYHVDPVPRLKTNVAKLQAWYRDNFKPEVQSRMS